MFKLGDLVKKRHADQYRGQWRLSEDLIGVVIKVDKLSKSNTSGSSQVVTVHWANHPESPIHRHYSKWITLMASADGE